MTFELKIELGNDAMQTGEDVAIVLRSHADYIATRYSMGELMNSVERGKHGIRDDNGNTVGFWQVTK